MNSDSEEQIKTSSAYKFDIINEYSDDDTILMVVNLVTHFSEEPKKNNKETDLSEFLIHFLLIISDKVIQEFLS